MPGSQVTVGIDQVEGQRLGYSGISLTEFATTTEPEIAAGSKVEVGGSLFTFALDEEITGFGGISNSSDIWVKIVPAGAAVTVEFTETPPAWSDSKQGWYSSNDRHVAWMRKDTGGNAIYKNILPQEQRKELIIEETIDIGTWDMDTDASKPVAHQLEQAQNFRGYEVFVRRDSGDYYVDKLTTGQDSTDGEMQGYVERQMLSSFSLVRLTGGVFDNGNYTTEARTRGWIRFKYKIL